MDRIALDPFPTGWYAVGFAWEVRRAPVRGIWFGRPLEVGRDAAGLPRVRPLDGGPVPEVVEQQDAVFAWFDRAGRPPTWRLPTPDPTGWTRYAGHCWSGLRTHPQETSENAVDVAHFSRVHGYGGVETLEEAVTDGPTLRARYAFTRRPLPYGVTTRTLRAEFRVEVVGLGYSFVENEVRQYGLRTRQLVLATPRDGRTIDLRIAGAVPRGPISLFLRWGLMRAYVQDVTDDLEIWQTKRYLPRPRIVAGDGPIGRYRHWARQFYAEVA